VQASTTYNFELEQVQSYAVTLVRGFPHFALALRVTFNEINDEFSAGFSLRPTSASGPFGRSADSSTFGR